VNSDLHTPAVLPPDKQSPLAFSRSCSADFG